MDKTKAAVHIFDTHAHTYQTKYMDISMYHQSLDKFFTLVNKPNATILELACGPGNITKYILEKNHNYQILATDLAPNMLNLAQANNPEARFQVLDCRNFSNLAEQFDALICGFGLPYISKEDAVQLIVDAAQKLKSNGAIYLSTMEDSYEKSGWVGPSSGGSDSLFMYFHEADYLIQALENNGFKQVEINRITYTDQNKKKVTDLILMGKKN